MSPSAQQVAATIPILALAHLIAQFFPVNQIALIKPDLDANGIQLKIFAMAHWIAQVQIQIGVANGVVMVAHGMRAYHLAQNHAAIGMTTQIAGCLDAH